MVYLALFGIILNAIVWKRGFYTLPEERKVAPSFLKLKHVFALFFIYVTTAFFTPPFLLSLRQFKQLSPLIALGWIQTLTLAFSLLLIFLYAQTLHLHGMKRLWKECGKGSPPILYDLGGGALCWFLTFPLVSVLGEWVDSVVRRLFGLQAFEQVAVRYLKMALGHPLLLVVALLTIIVIAPFLEEFLFRGILQTYLKKHLGRSGGITLASTLFALFHFAPSQGAGNISLIISLFAFACFLGFLYEKRQSLFAPIGLHMAFNLMSALRVLLIKEGV